MEDDLKMFSELAKQEQEKKASEAETKAEAETEGGAGTPVETDTLGLKTSSAEMADLDRVIDWHLGRAAKRQATSVETQEQIFDIQKEKQAVMRRLHEKLACLDDADCRPEAAEGEDTAVFDAETNSFRLMGRPENEPGADESTEQDAGTQTDQPTEATLGELITDLEWGIGHHLDKASVPRLTAKKYLIEQAKHELRTLLDRQIVKSESGSRAVHVWKREAYERLQAETDSGEVEYKTGSLAEKMVKNILKKACLDDGRMPFEVLDADVYQDVEEKIDFIIRRRDRQRGVNVETGEHGRDIAIQFTVNPQAVEKKREQIKRVKGQLLTRGDLDDLVLVVLPLPFVQELRQAWQDQGRPSGGPDKLMDREQAKVIFRGVLKDVMSEKELQDTWAKIAGRFQPTERDRQLAEKHKAKRQRRQEKKRAGRDS